MWESCNPLPHDSEVVIGDFVPEGSPSLKVLNGTDNQAQGTTFKFIMRDIDGLPVLDSTYEGRMRSSQFDAAIYFVPDCLRRLPGRVVFPPVSNRLVVDKGRQLRLDFVGHQAAGASGHYREAVQNLLSRSDDGLAEVRVAVHKVGCHVVKIRGPSPNGSFTELPWCVRVFGVCSEKQAPVTRGDQIGTCVCKRGAYLPATSDSASEDARPRAISAGVQNGQGGFCTACDEGKIKVVVGNSQVNCKSCVIQSADQDRQVTVGLQFEDHDNLEDCGCSAGFFLKPRSATARQFALGLETACSGEPRGMADLVNWAEQLADLSPMDLHDRDMGEGARSQIRATLEALKMACCRGGPDNRTCSHPLPTEEEAGCVSKQAKAQCRRLALEKVLGNWKSDKQKSVCSYCERSQ